MSDERIPLDLTLREVAAACGDGTYRSEVSFADFSARRPPAGHVAAAFEEIHPAAAATLIRQISEGLDNGYTGQGVAHPDFQRAIRQVARE